MITTKSELKEYLVAEKPKYTKGGIGSFFRFLGGFEAEVLWRFQRRLRITEYHKNAGHRIRAAFSLILLNFKRNKYGMHISLNTFDKGLHIMHLGPILVNDRVKVGKNCSIHISTALVAQGHSKAAPQVGDNCVIGVGVSILGDIRLGNGIAIGANAVVNKSFEEDNIAIAGVPAKKISDNGSGTWNRN